MQWLATAVCGLGNAADAVEIMAVSLLLPAAEEDLGLDSHSKAWLASAIFVGMLLGGMLWGVFSDEYGRKKPFVLAMGVTSVFGVLSATASSTAALVAYRTILGLGVGGSVPVAFSYLAELTATNTRGRCMVILASCWMFGSIYSSGLGWLIIPRYGWRPFMVVAALPATACGILTLAFMPESPRYWLATSDTRKCEEVLKYMARFNGKTSPERIMLSHLALNDSTMAKRGVPGRQMIQERARSLLKIWKGSMTRRSITLSVAWFAISCGWYGTVLWIPEIFKRNGAGSVSLYLDMFVVAMANLPGNVASIFLVDTIGRKYTLVSAMSLGSIAVILFALTPKTPLWGLASISVFNGISVAGWNALGLLTPESYPTTVRTTAMGTLGAIGRLGSISGQWINGVLMDIEVWLPLAVASVILMIGACAACFLPETKGKDIADNLVEAKLGVTDRERSTDNSESPPLFSDDAYDDVPEAWNKAGGSLIV